MNEEKPKGLGSGKRDPKTLSERERKIEALREKTGFTRAYCASVVDADAKKGEE